MVDVVRLLKQEGVVVSVGVHEDAAELFLVDGQGRHEIINHFQKHYDQLFLYSHHYRVQVEAELV